MNSEFSFSLTSCLTKAEEPSLPYYLPIAGGRIVGFIPFPRALGLCEMQLVSSRIWTHVVVSISPLRQISFKILKEERNLGNIFKMTLESYIYKVLLWFEFLRWNLIFIVQGFWTIVLIFIVIFTAFWLICPPAFFRCLSNLGAYMELQTTSFI